MWPGFHRSVQLWVGLVWALPEGEPGDDVTLPASQWVPGAQPGPQPWPASPQTRVWGRPHTWNVLSQGLNVRNEGSGPFMDHGGEVVGFALKQCAPHIFRSPRKAGGLLSDPRVSGVSRVALSEKSVAFDLLKTVPLIPGVFCL